MIGMVFLLNKFNKSVLFVKIVFLLLSHTFPMDSIWITTQDIHNLVSIVDRKSDHELLFDTFGSPVRLHIFSLLLI